ncbi:MAG: long-chain-acyl-CoA synthetase [Gammaproteobacteria bacterium]|nr:MAG: long-chain-acyl-CoA synthetase [Gammaproteobacteria bacterium]
MGIVETIKDITATLVQVPTLLALKKGMKPRSFDEKDSFAAQVERNVENFPDRIAIIFEGKSLTWREFNERANRYANYFRTTDLEGGDTVSLFMENRIEFLAVIVALNKLGVIAALINTNLKGRPLTHCVTVTKSKKCIVGGELASALAQVKAELNLREGSDYYYVGDAATDTSPNWAQDLNEISANSAVDNPPQTGQITLGDNALYVFTSGTTGMPKAAILSNRRFLSSADLSHKAGLKCTERDRFYICLPLYHATGLVVCVGAAFSSGASMFIRRKFSASQFLKEVREHETTCLIYIGELCRYLTNTPRLPDDHINPLQRMMGNGLRPDVWMEFKERFGIERITELYAASEGNVAFANLLNKNCTIGMTTAKIALVEYDVDADEIVRDEAGYCIEVKPGQPGLLLAHINTEAVFEGYTDKEATEKKIIRRAFEDDDAWFNSGDLIKEIEAGFTLGYTHYQFVDRIGDTFRWKSENVSTNEVGEIVNGFEQVKFCNVYGVEVPRTDGRAGMAAITLNDNTQDLDVEAFSQYLVKELPPYARPVFIRLQQDIDVTGTFKMLKGDLRRQGYDLKHVVDPLYVLKPGAKIYEQLDAEFAARINDGSAGY